MKDIFYLTYIYKFHILCIYSKNRYIRWAWAIPEKTPERRCYGVHFKKSVKN